MHTVWVVGPFPPPIHGAARVTRDVTVRLERRGQRLRVVDTSIDGAGPVYHVRRLLRHMRASALILLPRRGTSAVYVAGAGGLGLWYQAIVVAAARLARRPTFFHHHSYAYVARRQPVMSVLASLGGPRLTHVVLCDGMGAGLRELYPVVRDVLVCSNAGLVEPGPEPAAQATSTVVLGHLGNLILAKGVGTVVEAFRMVRAAGHDARLVLGGPAVGAESEAIVADAAAEFGDRFTYVGPVAADDVRAFYEQLDLFVFPSRYRHEAEPLVVLEAARSGVPAVAYAVGCLGALVSDPADLVPLDEDLPAAVERRVAGLRSPDARTELRRTTRTLFLTRNERAAAAQQDLCHRLATPTPPPRRVVT